MMPEGDIDILVLDDNRFSISEITEVKSLFWNQFGEQQLDIVCFSEFP